MANRSLSYATRTFLPVLLVCVLFLTACSGGNISQIDQLSDVSALEARDSLLTAAQELPKQAGVAATQVSAALPGVQTDPAGLIAPSGAEQPAAGAQPAVALAQPAPQVDASLPVEPRIGARAPEFSLQTLDGQTVSMTSLVGRPVVISYWATWCIPCQQELPVLQQLSQEYASAGLVVLTVNAIDQDSTDKIQTMIAEKGLTLPVLLDQGASFAGTYEAMFFPTTYYVDAAGVIRFIKLGDSTAEDLRAHVEGLLRGDL